MVLDSNILIYFAKPGGEFLAKWVGDPTAIISVVSRIEALGYPHITQAESLAIEIAVESLPQAELRMNVVQRAIALRRQKRMTLADAIVAATALEAGAKLITRNVSDFRHIAGLELENPFEPAAQG